MGTQPAPPKRGTSLFLAHGYCGHTVTHFSYCWALGNYFRIPVAFKLLEYSSWSSNEYSALKRSNSAATVGAAYFRRDLARRIPANERDGQHKHFVRRREFLKCLCVFANFGKFRRSIHIDGLVWFSWTTVAVYVNFNKTAFGRNSPTFKTALPHSSAVRVGCQSTRHITNSSHETSWLCDELT